MAKKYVQKMYSRVGVLLSLVAAGCYASSLIPASDIISLGTSPLASVGHGAVDSELTVSGLSGGAFFAVQFHVAFSARVHGVGVIAGGPYYCSLSNVLIAEGRCMRLPEEINVNELVSITKNTFTTTGTIDDPSNLASARVWLLSAEEDSVVAKGVVQAAQQYYEAFLGENSSQLEAVYNQAGEHAFLTADVGSTCTFAGEPFINACNYDAAGALLQHLHKDTLVAPSKGAAPSGLDAGNLFEFDQAPFLETGYTLDTASLYSVGYMYVPDKCQANATTGVSSGCRVHVAFHGCEQTVDDIGQQFPLETGYGAWAAANDFIVLYPQVKRSQLMGNPKGCFDWWGYTGLDYASRLGVQMAAVDRMVTSLASVDSMSKLGK